MKKSLLIIAVLGLSFASCKKDRVCSCKVVTSYKAKDTKPALIPLPADDVSDYNVTIVDASLRTANRACVHTKEESENTYWTTTYDRNCNLK